MAKHPVIVLSAAVAFALAIVLTLASLLADTIDDNRRRYRQQQIQAALNGIAHDAILPAIALQVRLPTAHIQSLIVIKKKGQAVAVVLRVVATGGYNGDITTLLAIRADDHAAVPTLRILAHRETPGIADFLNTPRAQTVFDGVSGATITANAITDAATAAKDWLNDSFDWRTATVNF